MLLCVASSVSPRSRNATTPPAPTRIPEVTECYNTSGAYDYLLKVRARDMKQYQEFVLNKLGEIESLASIESTFVMSQVKQSYGLNI